MLPLRFGASRKVGGVTFATVPAAHSNGVDPQFLSGVLAKEMQDNGLTPDLGPPNGYVLTFSNGLVAYLSGDTSLIADQKTIVHDYYKPQLVVMNIGDVFTAGPAEGAYVVNSLVEPREVIPSQANEAATKDGKVAPGSKTQAFITAAKVPARLPLSGRTMAFDAQGACVSGCD